MVEKLNKKNDRNKIIDIIRALCIISVVMGHCGFTYYNFTCRFETSLFFFLSGYFWKRGDDIRNFFIHKAKTLWMPYVIWNSVFLLFNNLLCRLGIYTASVDYFNEISKVTKLYGVHEYYSVKKTIFEFIKILFFMGGTELGGASWFFRILFVTEVVVFFTFYYLDKYIKNIYIFIIIISSLSGHALVYKQENLFGDTSILLGQIGLVFCAYSLLLLGVILHNYEPRYKNIINNSKGVTIIMMIGGSLSLLLYCSKVSIWRYNYGVMVTFFAVLFLYGMAWYIERYFGKARRFLIVLGQNTVPVFMGHFVVFKIINIIVACVEGYPLYYIAAFPRLGGWEVYGMLYTVTGVVLPLGLSLFWKRVSIYNNELIDV